MRFNIHCYCHRGVTVVDEMEMKYCRLNEILLPSASPHPLDTPSADAADACQHAMNRVTISLQELHSNLSANTGFLRLGSHDLYPTTDFCVDRIGSQEIQSSDVEILVFVRIPTLNKCCGLEYAFDINYNQCVRIRENYVKSRIRSRNWAKRNRFLARGSREHTHTQMHSAAAAEAILSWASPWRQYMEANTSYRLADNWLYEIIRNRSDRNLAIKNFTSQSCWFQYATR